MTNFQRIGEKSNAHVGRKFEKSVQSVLSEINIPLELDYKLSIGIDKIKKAHAFDLGSSIPNIIVECKAHKWTNGNNVPSAKMTTWNEAMYYFAIAPKEYRKILVVLRDTSLTRSETLAEYYVRIYSHLIPTDVEIMEYDESDNILSVLVE